MKIKVEKMNCPNCNSNMMEIDYDNYTARCPHCDAKYPIQIENGEAVFMMREHRKTMESEYEEQRKTAAFLNEEDRINDEFNRTKGFRNASDKLKWAKRGVIVGLIIGVILFVLSRNIIVSILSLAATIILFIPRMFDDKKTLNIWMKIICIIALIGLGAYSGYANNARKAAHVHEQQTLADEAAAPKKAIGFSSEEVTGKTYTTVVEMFEENGFTNVESKPQNDLEIKDAKKQDLVSSVLIKGNTSFSATDTYPENVEITVSYHNISDKNAKIEVGTSSEEMLEKQYAGIKDNLKGAGFVNIETIPSYDLTIGLLTKEGSVESVSIGGKTSFYSTEKFRYDDLVVITYHAKKSDQKNDHSGEVQIPSSAKKYIGRNYEDVVKELKSAGFENIDESRKVAQTKKEKSGDIVGIAINGKTDFDKDEWFAADATIIISYYEPLSDEELQAEHPDQIKVPNSSKELRKENYKDVVSQLSVAGFTNISSEPIYDLKAGIVNKEGSVETISIAGQADFEADAFFDPDSEIRITYHDFEETEEGDESGSTEEGSIIDKVKGIFSKDE